MSKVRFHKEAIWDPGPGSQGPGKQFCTTMGFTQGLLSLLNRDIHRKRLTILIFSFEITTPIFSGKLVDCPIDSMCSAPWWWRWWQSNMDNGRKHCVVAIWPFIPNANSLMHTGIFKTFFQVEKSQCAFIYEYVCSKVSS